LMVAPSRRDSRRHYSGWGLGAWHLWAGPEPIMDDAVQRTFASLTPRQRECLDLAAQHWTSKDIGRHLAISPKTVDRHLEDVIRKLGVADRLAAIRLLRADQPLSPLKILAPAHGDDPHTDFTPETQAVPASHEMSRGGDTNHGQTLADVHLDRRSGSPGYDRRYTATEEGGVLVAGTVEGGFGGYVSGRAAGGDHKYGPTPAWSALGVYGRTPEPFRRLGWILAIAAGLALAVGALIGSYDLVFSIHRIRVEQGHHYSSLDYGAWRRGA